ncbi:hypothetical protein [Gordonia tangerina]|uniref:Uncharacterized protein n=1 Tax=Gordonia tangerina TaxID=2911060 RepID=A0ABS9DPY6_9ACTN|nr:hypothetical protein [Gordonia tangerina]MCF3940644.1 hypothetical protein [Gordonia tangerina]
MTATPHHHTGDTSSRGGDTSATPWRSWSSGLALAGIGTGLIGAVLGWRWPTLTAVLILLTGVTVTTVWQWLHDRTVGGRITAATTTLALVAGWLVTVWLVEFPPVLVRLTLTLAGGGVVVAAGVAVHRRGPSYGNDPPPAQTVPGSTVRPSTGGEER